MLYIFLLLMPAYATRIWWRWYQLPVILNFCFAILLVLHVVILHLHLYQLENFYFYHDCSLTPADSLCLSSCLVEMELFVLFGMYHDWTFVPLFFSFFVLVWTSVGAVCQWGLFSLCFCAQCCKCNVLWLALVMNITLPLLQMFTCTRPSTTTFCHFPRTVP